MEIGWPENTTETEVSELQSKKFLIKIKRYYGMQHFLQFHIN